MYSFIMEFAWNTQKNKVSGVKGNDMLPLQQTVKIIKLLYNGFDIEENQLKTRI